MRFLKRASHDFRRYKRQKCALLINCGRIAFRKLALIAEIMMMMTIWKSAGKLVSHSRSLSNCLSVCLFVCQSVRIPQILFLGSEPIGSAFSFCELERNVRRLQESGDYLRLHFVVVTGTVSVKEDLMAVRRAPRSPRRRTGNERQ